MSTELELREEQGGAVTLFHTDDPKQVVQRASAVATELAKVIQAKRLTTTISGRQHVVVEGWTLLGTMVGVFPICVWSREVEGGYEARVEARTRDGALVGAAEAMCTRRESTWRSRDDYALRSMAQTRATSKALRQPLGFIMLLAGYDATPSEEIALDPPERPRARGGRGATAYVPPLDENDVKRQLKDMLDVVDVDAHPEWEMETAMKGARNSFKRADIQTIDDLTAVEAKAMLDALTPFVEVASAD